MAEYSSVVPLLFLLHLLTLMILIAKPASGARVVFDVTHYGADKTGRSGSTKAFLITWALACQSAKPAEVYVPKGVFVVGYLLFQGPCKSFMWFTNAGTIKAPLNYANPTVINAWIKFNSVVGMSFTGGIIDGSGGRLWACKLNKGDCPLGSSSVQFSDCSKVTTTRLTSKDSGLFHFVIHASEDFKMQATVINAPGNSPNTDGIHIQHSNRVEIIGASIKTGDDCISMGVGNTNIYIDNVHCGPGHGISIGSLANLADEDGVQNVTVKTARFTGSTNGFRIKSWARPSTGFVTNVLFQNAIMENVRNPINIDQNYCPSGINCPTQGSGIKINDIKFNHISGTSATPVAVNLDCSPTNPCQGISLTGIDLTYSDDGQPALSYCKNAHGVASGNVNPPSCLVS